ncbi:chromosome segregation protein SMC [Rothia sp. HMSC062F03]|uniref:chromosome segregation SMC family protein n=1 Tax=Rothia sp. HMSC062F03 TaxID=1715153 RepID=UPI0008A89539|nr:AAA family ATPase [Rothia sp. HMSC062F03]OHP76853.1 chromosome segregation protein SMC [Rothia sp. HMSC062F03]
MSLTLRGFKSFASATTFEFAPGINAVVGPNGSGKSNVLDALAWVMGEQGAKSLRGGSMKDVIFAGSGDGVQRAPLGRAKVTLTFDNSDGTLSIPADRVQISRTMFRSGGSEYEINGSPARLSDIQDLLSEAGLGQDMHVLVGQGQLDAVLHATSQQRRDMIEQAAGVVKYRRRQEKTSRKLESVASNLTRLSDLASELDSQLQPLSDQAESAATARQLQGRIRQLESVLLARQLGVLRAEQEQAATAEAQGTRRAEGLSEQLRAAREAAEAHREGQLRLTAEVTAAQAAVSSLRESAARTRSVQSIAAERVRTYRVELTEATAAARAGYERALEVLEERREESERATEQYAGFEERYAEALARVERAAEAVERCERSTGEAAHRRARAQEQLDAARAEAVEATRAYAAASERAATLREALGQSLGEDPAAGTVTEAPAAGDAASNVVASGEDEFDPETGELLEHAEPADSEAPAAGALRVLNAVQIDPEYARAAACALSTLATAALTESSAGPDRSHLRGEAPSHERVPAASLPEPHAERLAELGVRAALEVVEPLSEEAAALSGIDGETLRVMVAALRERLAGTLFAPSPEAAEAALRLLTAEYPETPEDSNDSETLESSESDTSTPEGETAGRDVFWRVFDACGVEYTRYSLLYPAEGVSALELAAAHREAERAVALTRASLDDAEAAVARARTASESAVEDERVAAKAAGVAAAEHARARAEAESLKDSALNVQNERARHVERLAAAERAVSEAESAYRAARTREDEYLAGTGEQAPAATVERRARRLLEVLSAEVTEREGQLRELSAELEKTRESALAADEEVRDLQSSHAAALTLLARTQTEAARVQERLQALAERVRLQTGVSLEQLGEDYSEQLPVDISENIESFAGAPENTAEKEATENTESAAKNVENADGAENPEDEPSEREIPTAVVRARLEATRAELTALGAINPLALEEYEALSERHAYLNQQIDDLKATRRDLNTVMDEVSSHIAEVFTAALEDINTHYRRIFATLFPGGEGHLELDDPADPLNAGVEIHARPAGKKVKRLSLLSGGERSLASLALLIAIYMSRPSPFYALDEVEAALDDRNLSRLLQVLGELGERSQLIVVTHQKRTMQMAQTLYGVSMREGVSAVLSQDMEELRELL